MYPYGPVRPRIQFSRVEVTHILLALVALIGAFTLWLAGGLGAPVELYAQTAILAVVAVPTAFLLHELGHKVVAQRYGFAAEFRAWPFGLILAIFTSLVGFIFAAPGAVMIQGVGTREQNGRISAAGPFVNLVVGGFFLLVLLILILTQSVLPILGSLTLFSLAVTVALISLIIGTFNMIPVSILDGAKILRWDLSVYLLLLAPIVALLVVTFLIIGGILP